jgi:hypothetical protein
VASAVCPECRSQVHRSHSRGVAEKVVRAFTSYRAYRCHECGWRGWYSKGGAKFSVTTKISIVSIILGLLASIAVALFALYIADVTQKP